MLSKYHLPSQLPGEKVLKVIRRDLFIITKRVLGFGALIVLPLVFYASIWANGPVRFTGNTAGVVIILGASAYYLFLWLLFFFSFIDYYLDVWIITSERIIDIQQKGFFSRVIAEQKLSRIQDVTSEVHGVVPTMLNYGDVHVQTAGAVQRFVFHQIPRPNEVRDMINKLAEEQRVKESAHNA